MPNAIWFNFGGNAGKDSDSITTIATNCINGKIDYIIPLVGDWALNGSINGSSVAEWKTWTSAIQAYGIKVLLCVGGSASPSVNISSASIRTTMINNIVNLVNNTGADGYNDDTEVCYPNGLGYCADTDIIALWNAMDDALKGIGKVMSASGYYYAADRIHMDFWSPQCYNGSGAAPAGCISNAIAKFNGSVLAGIGQYASSLSSIIQNIDANIYSLSGLKGICIFTYGSMTAADWIIWNNWKTKDQWTSSGTGMCATPICNLMVYG